jgi:Fe-S-cluster-containing dehydrogenase component
MKITRRGFFKIAGATAGAGLLVTEGARAEALGEDGPGVLVDTTLCVGCRACEAACSEVNHLPPPPEDDKVLEHRRDTSQTAFTVVNRTEKSPGVPRYAKKQCMHCISPACASACPVRAMDKLPTGPVVYDPSKCMGCRYCMVACPFDIPKYEYESAAPRVRKCTFCAARQAKGLKPACTEVCPSGALTFGRREALLETAKERIYRNPDRYVHHIYGEREAGGTSWLYLADVRFEQLALKGGVPEKSYPELVSGALGAPPFVMTLWPPLLMGLYAFSQRREEVAAKGGSAKHPTGAAGIGKEDRHG